MQCGLGRQNGVKTGRRSRAGNSVTGSVVERGHRWRFPFFFPCPVNCGTCQGSALSVRLPLTITGEHIWSAWMNDLFPVTDATFQQTKMDGSVVKQWHAPEVNLKSKVVCATCKNGWMSDIENLHAKLAMADLILGRRVGAISNRRARGLSLFAFKTAVITNRTLPEGCRYRSRHDFPFAGARVIVHRRKGDFSNVSEQSHSCRAAGP
jgi:hypothetical protein